ncbi:MAG: heavy metal translocating P-type ATPase [Anaerovoracaceae bacterium]|jgi:Cu+-exporting ATPase
MKKEKFNITGMSCASCQANITRGVSRMEGVQEADVNLLASSMTVTYDEQKVDADSIEETVRSLGYGAQRALGAGDGAAAGKADRSDGFRAEWQRRRQQADDEEQALKNRLISSLILLAPLMYCSMGHMFGWPLPAAFHTVPQTGALTQLLITIPILFLNRKFFINGFRSLFRGAPNMDSLVAVGAGASLGYGIAAIYMMMLGHAEYANKLYFESSGMILTLVTIGKYLEARSKAKTSGALDQLMDLAPKTATVIRDGRETVIPTDQIAVGEVIVIRPGDRVPADGVLLEGSGSVDQSAITGESIPVEKQPGDEIISATINRNGAFRFRAARVGEDTTLAGIIRLVDEAGTSRAPIARLADRVSGVFVPVVLAIAAVTTVIWLLLGHPLEFALTCGISVLVISCPCALGLATPVAIMVGTGRAAAEGILIKSAESLENLHKADTIVLDKTGTITTGRPAVTDVVVLADDCSEERLLELAAGLEAGSEHPLALAVVREAERRGLRFRVPRDFTADAGAGVRAFVDGHRIYAGNAAYMQECGAGEEAGKLRGRADELAAAGKTPLYVARDETILGLIACADVVRGSSRAALQALHDMGLRLIMLTGDNELTARHIAADLQIDEVVAGVRPAGKARVVHDLQKQGRRVIMVGDGINDAPALMTADIGVAIGAGTDIAMESADLVLMKNSLGDVVRAIELSRAVVHNIHINLFWAFFYNIIGIPIAAGVLWPLTGWLLNPMIAAAAMSCSSVCVVTNALRLRHFRSRFSVADNEAVVPQPARPAAAANPAAVCPMPDRAAVSAEPAVPAAEQRETAADNQVRALPRTEKGEDKMKKELKIEGMMCQHCRANVEKALGAVDGVREVKVDLDAGTALVSGDDLADDRLENAVTEAGYTVAGCRAV